MMSEGFVLPPASKYAALDGTGTMLMPAALFDDSYYVYIFRAGLSAQGPRRVTVKSGQRTLHSEVLTGGWQRISFSAPGKLSQKGSIETAWELDSPIKGSHFSRLMFDAFRVATGNVPKGKFSG